MAESAAKAVADSPEPSWLQKHGQKLFAAVFWLLLVGAYILYTARNGLTPLETFRQLVGFLSANAYGPLLFILLYTLRPLIFFSALVLTVGAGFLYGPVFRDFIYRHRGKLRRESGVCDRNLFRSRGFGV